MYLLTQLKLIYSYTLWIISLYPFDLHKLVRFDKLIKSFFIFRLVKKTTIVQSCYDNTFHISLDSTESIGVLSQIIIYIGILSINPSPYIKTITRSLFLQRSFKTLISRIPWKVRYRNVSIILYHLYGNFIII